MVDTTQRSPLLVQEVPNVVHRRPCEYVGRSTVNLMNETLIGHPWFVAGGKFARVIRRLGVAALATITMATALLELSSPVAPAGASEPSVTIPLTSLFYDGSNGNPVISVSIGNEKPINLLLDTGSIGLRVDSSALTLDRTDGITVSSRANSVTFGDGTRFVGTIAKARVRIDRIRTLHLVPFQLVNSTTCTNPETESDCQKTLKYEQEYRIDGTFGIGIGSGNPPNPLSMLPGSLGKSWKLQVGYPVTSTTSGELQLGAAMPTQGSVTILRLFRLKTSPGGMVVDVCWTIGSSVQVEVPTVFDSGSIWSFIWSPKLGALSSSDDNVLRDGSNVSMSNCTSRRSFYSFQASQELNPVLVDSGVHAAIAAVEAFNELTFTYDLVKRPLS